MRALAPHNPAAIYIAARNPSAAESEVAQPLRDAHPGTKIATLQLDLSSLASARACAAEFTSQSQRLDLLFLNAGVCAAPAGVTTEGYEVHFGINHVGHALLTPTKMRRAILSALVP